MRGVRDAESWQLVDDKPLTTQFTNRWKALHQRIHSVCSSLAQRQSAGESLPPGAIVFLENTRLLETAGQSVLDALNVLKSPGVLEGDEVVPRPYQVAAGFLGATNGTFAEEDLIHYLEGAQQAGSLMMAEIWALKPMLEGALLEKVDAPAAAFQSQNVSGQMESVAGERRIETVLKCCQGLRALQEMDWEKFFERTSAAERALQRDPSGVYARMDDASRQMYRSAVEELARESLFSEEEVARQSVFLAMRAHSRIGGSEVRSLRRKTHVGYYLLAGGVKILKRRLGCKPSWKVRLLNAVLNWPEVFYVVGVEVTTLALVIFLLHRLGAVIPLLPGLLLLIPASHAAVGIINRLTSILVPPRRIPKMDFSDGIPLESSTLVAVPCLLLQ